MAITRRQFLKWSGVSTLGAVVFNGCRIPEDELQVESPVNLPEDLVTGTDNWYATLCRQDAEGCGIIVRVVEGRAKKVAGNPDYPVNQGKHSVRSDGGLQALYHPDRIATPLFREQRSGEFAVISWSDARKKVSDKLAALGDKSKFLMVTDPLRGHQALVAKELVQAYGGRHMSFEPLEQANLNGAIKAVFGQSRLPDFDIGNTKYLVSFGADFLSTWLTPVRYSKAYGEFRQGDRTRGMHVQVDSRFSMTAANADEWLPVKPGGEGALAMSMIYVIIAEGLGDASMAAALTGDQGHQALAEFRPDNPAVFASTGLESERITELAMAFADPANQPSLAIGGGSAGAYANGLFNLKAVYALNLLVGNVNKPGGVILNPAPPLEELATEEVLRMGVGANLHEWRLLGDSVDVLMVRGANPVHGLPRDAGFNDVIDKSSFVVAFASIMDETVAMADLVLPEYTYLEDWGDDVPNPGPGYQIIGLQQPVVRPFQEGAHGFGDELLVLGRTLGLGVDAKLGLDGNPNLKDVLRKAAETLWKLDRGSVRAETFDGFWNGILQRGGWWDTAARSEEAAIKPAALQTSMPDPSIRGREGANTYNLVPFLSNSITDGRLAHLPWLQAAPDPITSMTWDTWVEINLKTAKEVGIGEGDILEVKTADGTIEAPAYPHPAVPPWTVAIPIGEGHTYMGRYAEGVGANTMSLLASVLDDDTQALGWAATRVEIKKTGKHVDVPKFEGEVLAVEAEPGRVIKVTAPD